MVQNIGIFEKARNMPFFGNFGSKKKSKSSLGLAEAGSEQGYSNQEENHDKRTINKLERINHDLEEKNNQLEEEVNMMKLKVEILLDMLAQKTAEGSFQETEIERLESAVKMMTPESLTMI